MCKFLILFFVFVDDMTYSDIHALGNNKIKTPNLDQLINQGTPLHMLIKARDIDNDSDLDILLGSNSGVFMDKKKAQKTKELQTKGGTITILRNNFNTDNIIIFNMNLLMLKMLLVNNVLSLKV
ncbi:hypothetical protein [Thalassobellus suaedae]|uniref:Uncharacterized protein n=1 Tax=Thalassobellus suaedae TaxID=3074124 RepID=A0ABY9Y0Z5_9FLAO|nr:hypothetical protein RHP49_13495 [Flavobacteriaceae bacterium HL-DH10]